MISFVDYLTFRSLKTLSSFTITPEVSFRACKWNKAEEAKGKGGFQEVLEELQAPFPSLAAARLCARPLPATRNPGRRAVRREPLGAEFRLNWRSQALGLSSRRPGPLRPSPGPQEARPPYHSIFHSGSEAMGERGARRQQSVWEENSVKDLWKVDKSHVFNSEV